MASEMGVRRFGNINWVGLMTLSEREIRRFSAIWLQTIMAPLVTAGLFLAIFVLAIGPTRPDTMGVPFVNFLVPGILMMTVIQNAFANTSSSLISAKVQGNIVDTLMPPLSAAEIVLGYLAGGIARGFMVALSTAVVLGVLFGIGVEHPIWLLVFVLLGSAFMALLGFIAALLANKFDQMAAITNFIVTPLSLVSGTFYSIERLPPVFQTLSHINPIFYFIDGARFGTIGVSDSSPWIGLAVSVATTSALFVLCWRLVRRGYRLKP